MGPILGGFFAQALGWHAIFWLLTGYAGMFLCVLVVFLPETLRSKVGNGSRPVRGLSMSVLAYLQLRKLPRTPPSQAEFPVLARTASTTTSIRKALPVDFLGPIKIIFTIEVSFAILFLSIYYTVWKMIISILSTLFKITYSLTLTTLQIGLCFLRNKTDCIINTLTTSQIFDFDYARFKKSFKGPLEDFPLEKARLRTLWLWSGLQMASALIFGSMVEYRVHISVSIICTSVLGWCATSIISVVKTFMVDIFPKKGASATASLNLVRCLLGAGGTAAVLPLVDAIGAGWTFTLLTGDGG